MSTELPNCANCPKEARAWWGELGNQERIIWALDAVYQNAIPAGFPHPADVAEDPWKWAEEAHVFYEENKSE